MHVMGGLMRGGEDNPVPPPKPFPRPTEWALPPPEEETLSREDFDRLFD